MDNLGSIFISLNKISLLALIITFGFVLYQVYLLKKDTEEKKKKLTIPDFKTGETYLSNSKSKILLSYKKKVFFKSSILPFIIGLAFLLIFGFIFFIGLFYIKNKVTVNINDNLVPTVNFVASKGIKVYNENWEELPDSVLKKIKPGEIFIVTIETIKEADIDMARIRVNKSKWDEDDITMDFNKKLNAYYKKCTIATGEAFLRIEAELHSKSDGWLSD